MTVGDVNAVMFLVGATGVTLWAAMVGTSVLFGERVQRAAMLTERETGKTLGIGTVLALTAGVTGLILSNAPNGLAKLIGLLMLMGLLAIAVLGSAGLASVAGERIRRQDEKMLPLGATGRGAALLVMAGFLPVLGWFFFFPLLLLVSVGAGWRSLPYRVKRNVTQVESVVETPARS